MGNLVDQRGKLEDEVFTYRVTKDKRIFIAWCGRQVTVLSGSKAEGFLANIAHAQGKDAQLIMAKVTGNFKRGNEKMNKQA